MFTGRLSLLFSSLSKSLSGVVGLVSVTEQCEGTKTRDEFAIIDMTVAKIHVLPVTQSVSDLHSFTVDPFLDPRS
jgi:hypothetical protein